MALYGYSYSAITALLGAALEPKHLDAVVVGHPPTDPYRDVVWQNGLYDQGFVDQWFAGQTAAQSIGIGYQPQILDRAQQQFAVETRLLPYDGPVYYERSVLAKVRRIKVPVYVFTGWEDMYSRGDMRLIDSLRTPSLLVINASTHHGTDQGGELGAPYGGSIPEPGQQSVRAQRHSAPRRGHRLAQPLGQGDPQRHRHQAPRALPRSGQRQLGTPSPRGTPRTPSLTDLYLSAQRSGSAPLSPNDGTLAPRAPHGSGAYQDSYVYNPAAGASVPMGKDGPDGFLPVRAARPAARRAPGPDLHDAAPEQAPPPGRAI